MSDKPDPPVSPDIDLKDFPFTPIYRARLFGSSFHARANDAEWRAGLTLWLKSQDQVPAGSLPTDDIDLCRLAELGRDMRTWLKVKAMALHGWVECADGRLYHNVVTGIVTEQWQRKLAQRDRTEAARAARAAKRLSQSMPQTENPSVTDTVTGSKGQGQGQGQGIYTEDPNGSSAAGAAPRDPVGEIYGLAEELLGHRGRSIVGKARKEFGEIGVMQALLACRDEGPSEPVPFFLKCLEARKKTNGRRSPHADETAAFDAITRRGT